jgi:hypothetical protein
MRKVLNENGIGSEALPGSVPAHSSRVILVQLPATARSVRPFQFREAGGVDLDMGAERPWDG